MDLERIQMFVILDLEGQLEPLVYYKVLQVNYKVFAYSHMPDSMVSVSFTTFYQVPACPAGVEPYNKMENLIINSKPLISHWF